MDYQQLLEIALKENSMLKNSFNVYSDQLAKMLGRLEGVFYDTQRLSRIEENIGLLLDNQKLFNDLLHDMTVRQNVIKTRRITKKKRKRK